MGWRMAGRIARAPRLALAVAALLVLAGCASAPGARDPGDPFEQTNRTTFAFNNRFNNNVTLPIAWVYVYWLPTPVRKGLNNFMANAQSPVTFANDLLQGDFTRAGETLGRFFVNTVGGAGGFVDVATKNGLPPHPADFGQTLARYGVPSGPFLVLPIIGPSTPRDIVGTGVDLAVDPLFYIPADWSLLSHAATVIGVHTVAPFQQNAGSLVLRRDLGKGSVDPYATMRSVYRQQRARQVEPGLPSMDD